MPKHSNQVDEAVHAVPTDTSRSTVTVLRHSQRYLVKTWQVDGTVRPYDHAKHFSIEEVPLSRFDDLSRLLLRLEWDPHACLIRGTYIGNEPAGAITRVRTNFKDLPLHPVLIEVDGYEPLCGDPVTHPIGCIQEYIWTVLPPCFHDTSFHWQLSNSAGHFKYAGRLKAHIWFWLQIPYTSLQVRAWAKALSLACDHSVFNPVQIHFTGSPIFERGIVDPVPTRSGMVRGVTDAVPLVIDPSILEAAETPVGTVTEAPMTTPEEDPVGNFLIEKRMVLSRTRDRLYVKCPWDAGHSSGTVGDTSSAWLLAGTGNYAKGHYKCFHRSCEDRTDQEFLEEVGFTDWQGLGGFDVIAAESSAVPPDQPLVLDHNDCMGMARSLVMHHFTSEERALLIRSNGSWYVHIGQKYCEREEDSLRVASWNFLAKARKFDSRRNVVPFQPKPQQVSSVLDALKAVTYVEGVSSPSWLDHMEYRDARDVVSLENGLLHIPTRTLMPHSSRFFTVNSLPYAWNPDSSASQWQQFLDQIWPTDPESQATLQEIFGYLLTADTGQQKMFLIIGPKRSGKGTMGRILKRLVGPENYVGPTLTSLTGSFGLQPLIGKLVAVIPDARIGSHTNVQAVVERLLMISGEDTLTVDRKNREAWTGTLPTRFVVFSNEVPQLGDASGALHARFITLSLPESFYGREDLELTSRLQQELSGIFNWALDGRDRLNARGRFLQPQSGADIAQELGELSSPIATFLKDKCEIGPSFTVEVSSLYNAWCEWCSANGRAYPGSVQTFGKWLHAALPQTRKSRPRFAGFPVRHYEGIGLKASPPSCWEAA